jgi:hypothetical protein
MNLEKVGKEQAQSKEALVQAQAAQVQRLQKEHDQGQHAVGKTNADIGPQEENAMKVKADGRKSGSEGQARPRSDEASPGEDAEKEKKETAWKDPELGKHVDLSG